MTQQGGTKISTALARAHYSPQLVFHPSLTTLPYPSHNHSGKSCMSTGRPRPRKAGPSRTNLDELIKSFVTQRAVQTVLFYSLQLRDETSFHWLEDFAGHTGLYDLHHYDGLRMPWRQYILTLFRTPSEELLIKKPIPGRGGATAINPYIQKRYFEYTVTVEPRNIGRRLLSCREQIAKESMDDLMLIEKENHQAIERHRSSVSKTPTNDEMASSFPPLEFDPAYNTSTPFRGGTYDLLKKYATYLAARSVLYNLEKELKDEGKQRDAVWFKEFCATKCTALSDPASGYHSAELFVQMLLDSPPAIRSGGALFDPMKLARDVMEERQKVAEYWTEVLSSTSEDHLSIKRELIEGSWE